MEKEHLKAISVNKELNNYSKDYCECCGQEMDVFENEKSRQDYFEYGKICEVCRDNN